MQIGYYDQEQSDLDATKTVLSQVWDEHPLMDRTTVRSALAQFLFRGNDVDKPVAGLSGGERSRLNLCRLMLQRANTLFMDEPTNHLDIPSKEALEAALVDYDGTLLFISHDRYFIDAIATHVGICRRWIDLVHRQLHRLSEKLAENERIREIEAGTGAKSPKGTPPTLHGRSPKAGSNRTSKSGIQRADAYAPLTSARHKRLSSASSSYPQRVKWRWNKWRPRCLRQHKTRI